MGEAVNLMKKLVDDEKISRPGVKDESVNGGKQEKIEIETRKEFSIKSREVGNEIQRLIHEAQGLNTYEELGPKVEEIEKYREEEVYKKYQKEIGDLKIKLNGFNESGYREGVVKRIEDKLKEFGKKEDNLDVDEKNDLAKIKAGTIKDLNEIGKIESKIITRISKKSFSDILDNLIEEANELVKNIAKGTADKLQSLRKGLYSFQLSSNIYCREIFETRETEVKNALNSLENISYPETAQEGSSLFRPEVIIPVSLISLLVVGILLLVTRKVRK